MSSSWNAEESCIELTMRVTSVPLKSGRVIN